MVLTFEYIVLSFESEDKILWCDNSNETSMVVFSLFTIYLLYVFFLFCFVFFSFYQLINFGIFATLGVNGSHVTGKVDALLQTTYDGHLFFQPLSLAFHKAGTSVGRRLSC